MSSSQEGIYEPGIIDPGIPVHNPTTSFWESSPHPLASHQSPWPMTDVDVLIIGSGLTGTSLASTLLNSSSNLRVVIVDARKLCSGATGRNGGHVKTMAYATWEHHKQAFGVQEALRIAAFEHSHLKTMIDAIRHKNIKCDLLMTKGVDAYYDSKCFKRAVAALADMREHGPHLAEQYTVYTDRYTIREVMKLSDQCIGAISVPAASLWPYKFVMWLLNDMVEAQKLNVQAHTTVQKIEDNQGDDVAEVVTNRGTIKARHVVHASNGWLGHLVPELRPFISPVRGNVVRYGSVARGLQILTEASSQSPSALGLDSEFSFWLRYAAKDYDYLVQRKSGDVVVGRAGTGRRSTGDDSQTDLPAMKHLGDFAGDAARFAVPNSAQHITHAWSGILGFTEDTMPFVGRLPFPRRSHQWVCGGYHGLGMVKAFRAGEMVAQLIMGKDLDSSYPRSFLVNKARLHKLEQSTRGPRTTLTPVAKL